MAGKCFGLLAAVLVFASQAATYGGWCGTSHRCCYVSHHCCYVPHTCCRPCPPCPPIYYGRDCIYNATNRVLSVSVTHGGGTESRRQLAPRSWFYFSFDPARHRSATVVAHDAYTNRRIINQTFPLINHPSAPGGCIWITFPGGYAEGAEATLERGGQPVPENPAP